jgi:hypothetical protein
MCGRSVGLADGSPVALKQRSVPLRDPKRPVNEPLAVIAGIALLLVVIAVIAMYSSAYVNRATSGRSA